MKLFASIRNISILVSLLSISSCSKDLDQQPISDLTESNFYQNTNDFNQSVNGVYAKLVSYPSQALWLGEMRSDNLNAIHDGNRDWQGINDFTSSITTTGFVLSAWRDNFNGIFNANTTLAALKDKGSVISDAALRTRFEAETRFLRAFYYFQLVRLFGSVPLLDAPLNAAEAETIPRSEPEKIYGLIISDLEFASANLPAGYSGSSLGRASSWAAKALLAQVYLSRSGKKNGVNGPGLESAEWAKAQLLIDEIIASKNFRLLDSYASVFAYNNENNAEVIFDVQFMSGSNGAPFPSHLVPVAYWLSKGLSNAYGNGFGASSFAVSQDLKTSYSRSTGDTRSAFNIELSYSSPFFKKYIDLNKRGLNGRDWPVNYIVIRYADILLMKAECLLNSGGSASEALGLINEVRKRAGADLLNSATEKDLLEERRLEFAGEGLRWNDLVRSGQASTIMNQWRTRDKLSNVQEITENYLLYPVPADEISVKAGLYTQNPGY